MSNRKWLRAISHPYLTLLFPAEWEEQAKARVAHWFEVKFVEKGGPPTPFVWRALDFKSSTFKGAIAQVMVEEKTEHCLDQGGMAIQGEPVVYVAVAGLRIRLRVGDVGAWVKRLERKLDQPSREKYGVRFWDVVSWPDAGWMVPDAQILADAVAALRAIESKADQTFNTFMAAHATRLRKRL